MKTLISIDPGVSSAYSVLEYSDTSRPILIAFDQFTGGTESLIREISSIVKRYPEAHVICEDFTARNNSGFGYTTVSLEPLVGIGALMALGIIDRGDRNQMCAPALQYFLPGENLADKKKKRRLWLSEKGFRVMPKDVGQPDCDDVRSSLGHAIAWLRRKKHNPTLELFRTKEKND